MRVFHQDVCPYHHPLAPGTDKTVQFEKKIGIDSVNPSYFAQIPAAALAQFPWLVTANIETVTGKHGKKLIVEQGKKGNCFTDNRRQRR
jgi:hypothetical protein